MPNRSTGIGWAWRHDQDDANREILSALENCGGCVIRAALELGVSTRSVYRFIERGNLWDALEQIRQGARRVPDDVARARAALTRSE